MKNLFIFGLMLFSISTAKAQDLVRKQEFQVSLDIMEGLKNANLYYKVAFKNNPNKYWRSRFGHAAELISRNNSLFVNRRQLTLGMGFETRLPLIRKSLLTLGVEPFGYLDRSKEQSLNKIKPGSTAWATGVAFPIGIIINGSSEWYVALETGPTIYYQETTRDDYEVYGKVGNSTNFSMSSFALCFGYRIPTKRI